MQGFGACLDSEGKEAQKPEQEVSPRARRYGNCWREWRNLRRQCAGYKAHTVIRTSVTSAEARGPVAGQIPQKCGNGWRRECALAAEKETLGAKPCTIHPIVYERTIEVGTHEDFARTSQVAGRSFTQSRGRRGSGRCQGSRC